MYVYVLSKSGKPLMPTKRLGKVRHMLKDGMAKVVQRTPFTIQLTYDSKEFTQDIALGVDAGSKTVGLSATTDEDELYASNVILRNDIVKLLADRRALRSSRRNRKRRYRQARFDNRVKSKKKGWLAPSVLNKINTHLKVIADVYKILPITKLIVEIASFDIQKIENPDISGEEYQQGEQLGFWNVREYVLCRDNHECQYCHGKSKDNVLNVHHIESRKTGGNSPSNLITLCETCHHKYHHGEITINLKRGKSFRDAAFMGIMRWSLYNKLKELYPNVHMTYGYKTKNLRINNNLPKEHYIDARCISGNTQATPLGYIYYQRKVRCHNRKIHKQAINKGGIRKKNQSTKYVFGYQLFDKVSVPGNKVGFIYGRRVCGSFDIRDIFGNRIKEITYKKIRLIKSRENIIKETVALPIMTEKEKSFRKEVEIIMKAYGASEEFIQKNLTESAVRCAIKNRFSPDSLAWSLLQ